MCLFVWCVCLSASACACARARCIRCSALQHSVAVPSQRCGVATRRSRTLQHGSASVQPSSWTLTHEHGSGAWHVRGTQGVLPGTQGVLTGYSRGTARARVWCVVCRADSRKASVGLSARARGAKSGALAMGTHGVLMGCTSWRVSAVGVHISWGSRMPRDSLWRSRRCAGCRFGLGAGAAKAGPRAPTGSATPVHQASETLSSFSCWDSPDCTSGRGERNAPCATRGLVSRLLPGGGSAIPGFRAKVRLMLQGKPAALGRVWGARFLLCMATGKRDPGP